jgi:hypothetical protein
MDTNVLGLDSKSLDGCSICRENMIIQKRPESAVLRTARKKRSLLDLGERGTGARSVTQSRSGKWSASLQKTNCHCRNRFRRGFHRREVYVVVGGSM